MNNIGEKLVRLTPYQADRWTAVGTAKLGAAQPGRPASALEDQRLYPRSPEIRYQRPAGGMPVLGTPARVAEYVLQYLSTQGTLNDPREHAYALALNIKNRLLCEPYLLAIGTEGACLISVSELCRFGILAGARALILVHTHPSGECTPSREDQEVTRRAKLGAELLDLQLHDHLIVAGCNRTGEETEYFSLREAGMV